MARPAATFAGPVTYYKPPLKPLQTAVWARQLFPVLTIGFNTGNLFFNRINLIILSVFMQKPVPEKEGL